MVTLREINNDNFSECVKLEVDESQKNFVANNMKSLAEAWVHYANAQPFAIYNNDEMVGFMMFYIEDGLSGKKKECFLWRLMIDKKHQGKGYGKTALKIAVEDFKNKINFAEVKTYLVPGNEGAENLYKSLGFMPTGEIEEGEIVMKLKL